MQKSGKRKSGSGSYANKPYKKPRAQATVQSRAGYSTVPRSRGVYAIGEMKYFDTERSGTALTASVDWTGTEYPPNVGTPTTLVVPVTGSAINQRIGRRINLHKLRIRGIINCAAQVDQTAADNASLVRILLVWDCQTNATQAQGEEVMAAPTTASAQNVFSSFQSLASLGRFKILKDKKLSLQNPNSSYDGTNVEVAGLARHFKFDVVFKNPVSISFNAANGGTIADIVDNSFFVMAMATSTNLAPTISYQARAYFKE